jgi:hypothetical protein
MSSNFLQFNPNLANQETDAEYAADSMRSGGAQLDSVPASDMFNKFGYQTTTFIAAMAQALANKGYTIQDASLSVLTSTLAAVLTEADLNIGLQNFSYTASPAWNALRNATFEMVLTGNVTAPTISGQVAGQRLIFIWHQSTAGGNTILYPSNFYGWSQISSVASSINVQEFIVSSALNCYAVGPLIVI